MLSAEIYPACKAAQSDGPADLGFHCFHIVQLSCFVVKSTDPSLGFSLLAYEKNTDTLVGSNAKHAG